MPATELGPVGTESRLPAPRSPMGVTLSSRFGILCGQFGAVKSDAVTPRRRAELRVEALPRIQFGSRKTPERKAGYCRDPGWTTLRCRRAAASRISATDTAPVQGLWRRTISVDRKSGV